MERASKRMRRSLNRAARADVACVVQPWADEQGVSDEEREQRKVAAREMKRALQHKLDFASDQAEMAWLKQKAKEAGVLADFGGDTPSNVWKAQRRSEPCTFLKKLGPDMKLEKMALLTSLPDGLHVDGSLDLWDCTGLTSLPNNLHVGDYLDLCDCAGLASLPASLHIGGYLNLTRCSGLTSLPDDLHVARHLDLTHCSGLTSLPKGLHFCGDLRLTDCTGLTSLPTGLHFGGNLYVSGCTGLTSLPAGLRVDGHLNLRGCTGLTSLPDGLRVARDLDLQGCTGLTSLPDDLHVARHLDLTHCTGLVTLPGGMHNGRKLGLEGCTGLTSLPTGLHVSGDLDLSGCTGLASLPDGLHVSGDLDLSGCTGLASLPDGLCVGGDLDLSGCAGLTSLPDGVLEWVARSNFNRPRNINLTGSGLPPEELARLQALDNPALRFHVSYNETFGGSGHGADENSFTSLDDAAAFWGNEAGQEGSALGIAPSVEPAYVRGVLGFLSKLRRAKEFNNSLTKKGLASRVVQVLVLLTGEDKGVREELQVRMADAVDTCSDKPMWALNQMQVLVHVVEARGDRVKLRALGMGVMRLELVHRHVRKAMDAMNFIDDVCVYLRFEIALQESLNLPVSALEMLYPSYITVTQESIDAAEAEALALADEVLMAWLPTWSEWQRQDRVEFAEKLDFSALKRNSTKTVSASAHGLLGNEVTDPVRLEPLSTVWSLQDLMTHWINTGMDLNNTPRDVDYMRLNLTKCK